MTRASRAAQEELFESRVSRVAAREQLEPGAFVLRAFASDEAPALLDAIRVVARRAPFRHMTTAAACACPSP
jgi:alkylated DNA repair dioxygenase AlkB